MTRTAKIAAWVLLALSPCTWANDDPTLDCKTNTPEVVNPIKDYQIIVSNMASIETEKVFSGKHLIYSVIAKTHAKDNELSINPRNGLLTIAAGSKDSFEVQVKVTNSCGSTSSTFNVDIIEEE